MTTNQKTQCDLCDSPATVWGTVGAYCEPCSTAFAKRVARAKTIAPAITQRLINGTTKK